MAWKWYGNRVQSKLNRGVDRGLIAAAYIYMNAVKRALAGGYTSGLFVTGNSISHVTRSEPEAGPGGSRQIRVGTNLLYNLAWELGHVNLFTRRYERVEIWRPELIRQQARIRSAFAAQISMALR